VVQALQRPRSERPQLLIAHFDGPQDVVQGAGLRSDEARDAAARIDRVVGEVKKAIDGLPAGDPATLVVATNHGLLPVWTEVNLVRVLHNHDLDIEFAAAGTTAFLYIPNPEDVNRAIRALSGYQRQLRVYLKGSMPAEWNFRPDGRVGELVLVANPPYILESPRRWRTGTAWLAEWLPEMLFVRPFMKAGAGYPPEVRGMPGVFYAWGAGVAPSGEITRLNSVDVHPTICGMLGIRPGTPLDGTVVAELLPASSRAEAE
jgi:alkaline phosphatase D